MAFYSNGHIGGQRAPHEVIVIGGGLMGSAAAWHLSNQGKSVLLLEKQGPIYDSGSSMGKARIARSSNIENDELWSYLHNCTVREVELLVNYVSNQGVALNMECIYTTSPVSYLAKIEELDQLLENLKKQGINYEIAATDEQGKSKFGVSLKKGTILQREYKKYSGTINPHKLIKYLHKAIKLKRNHISYGTKVGRIEKKDGLYSVFVTDSDNASKILTAKQIVSAAGPYTGSLLKNIAPYFDTLINPKRIFLIFLKIENTCYQSLTEKQKQQLKNAYPVIDRAINHETEEFYAMIENYDPDGSPVIKIGGHFQRSSITNLDKVWRTKLSTDEINWSLEKTLGYLNMLNLPINLNQIEVVDSYPCVYSLTETEVPFVTPIIDAANGSKDKNLVVMAGLSGVGAKGTMAYGLIAANLLTDKENGDPFYNEAVAKLGYERLRSEVQNN